MVVRVPGCISVSISESCFPRIAYVDQIGITVHYFQSFAGEHYQRIDIVADKTDFDSGIYGGR